MSKTARCPDSDSENTQRERETETERDRERKGGGMTLRCADGRVVINANGSIYISRRITSHNASTI